MHFLNDNDFFAFGISFAAVLRRELHWTLEDLRVVVRHRQRGGSRAGRLAAHVAGLVNASDDRRRTRRGLHHTGLFDLIRVQ